MPLQQAEGRLAEIIERLPPGGELVLTRDDKPVATLRSAAQPETAPRFGTLMGSILRIAPDFDAIPEGFQEYVE